MNNFNPFDGVKFNPLEALKDKNVPGASFWLESLNQNPWLSKYIEDILGPDFWQKVLGKRHSHIHTSVFETSDEVIVRAEIPGLEKESDVIITLQGMTLSLEANIPEPSVAENDRVIPLHNQITKGTRKLVTGIKLPCAVRDFGARANYKNGILEVRLPKEFVSSASHRINVKFL